jgi:hypothetical protein
LNQGLLVPEADAMSTAPRRKGQIQFFYGNSKIGFVAGANMFWTIKQNAFQKASGSAGDAGLPDFYCSKYTKT